MAITLPIFLHFTSIFEQERGEGRVSGRGVFLVLVVRVGAGCGGGVVVQAGPTGRDVLYWSN